MAFILFVYLFDSQMGCYQLRIDFQSYSFQLTVWIAIIPWNCDTLFGEVVVSSCVCLSPRTCPDYGSRKKNPRYGLASKMTIIDPLRIVTLP